MSSAQTTIPCAVLRGGTSRGVYFRAEDLPVDTEQRDRVLLAVVGGPDELQIDGIGGGHPLTNKVASVSPSERDDADVDYLFLQTVPQEARVSTEQNCGNILVGVGPFVLETGLFEAASPRTVVRVHMVNSGSLCELTLDTPDGELAYGRDGARVVCDYIGIAGSTTGALLPTGSLVDTIDGIDVTCVDNGMPVVVIRAADLEVVGDETPEALEGNVELTNRLEALRLKVGSLMNLGDVGTKTVPKMCLVSAPNDGGIISTRTFIPHACHRAVGILGAISVATACVLPGSVCGGLALVPDGDEKSLHVEHPSGALLIRLVVDEAAPFENRIRRAGVVRTARLIMKGETFAPGSISLR